MRHAKSSFMHQLMITVLNRQKEPEFPRHEEAPFRTGSTSGQLSTDETQLPRRHESTDRAGIILITATNPAPCACGHRTSSKQSSHPRPHTSDTTHNRYRFASGSTVTVSAPLHCRSREGLRCVCGGLTLLLATEGCVCET
jgi:hypothetical protein